MAKQNWYAEQGYNKAPGVRGMLQRAMPGGRSGWNEPTWWDPDNMANFTEEDWQKFNEDDPDYAYRADAYRGESGPISREEGIARAKSTYGPITRDRNNDGVLDLNDADPNYQEHRPGERPWWKNETPILNQSGTFKHGGGTFEEFDYDVPNDVDFDSQVFDSQRQMPYRPPLNQGNTFEGGWEDFDYDVPFPLKEEGYLDDIAYGGRGGGPLGEASQSRFGGALFQGGYGGGSVGEGGFQPGDANAGRFDDTMMRNVGGEQSHVNPQEAGLIDNYGLAGEDAVKKMGSGTINPVTGKKEYSLILAGMAVSAIGAGLGAYARNKGLKKAKQQQKKQMQDVKAYQQMGEEFMDPESQRNRMYLQNIQQQSMNQMAMQNQMAQRNAAAQGGGGFSGAQAAAQQQAGLQSGLQGRQQWLGMMSQQQNTGLGILGSALQQKGAIRDTRGEIGIAQGANVGGMFESAGAGISGGIQQHLMGGGVNTMSALGSGTGYDPKIYAQNQGGGSDIELKENIDLVGKSPSGINIYEFDYKDKSYGEGRHRGVMAQEVPEASFRNTDGYLWVDYSKIDVDFEKVRGI